MSDVVVELMSVVKRYDAVRAVDGVTLNVHAGEILGLLGHNGAGKTTTMKMILGLSPPSAGTVRVFGRAPYGGHTQDLRLKLGYLPESVSFYEQLSGREVLAYFARLKGVRGKQCEELLERVGLTAAADRRVKTYSKGMRQRLGLAQALLGHPRLLLLDEPTVGLDPMATRDFYGMLDELGKQGTTVILSSHVLPGIEAHIHRAAIMGKGRLLAVGTLEELRRQRGLPCIIRARGHWAAASWEARLQRPDISDYKVNGTRLELSSTNEAKLDIMRMILSDPAVRDVELSPPSLETLYAHFSSISAEQAA